MKLKRQVFSYPYIVWMLIFILVPMLLIVFFAFRSDTRQYHLRAFK